jgi:hypothetical protein
MARTVECRSEMAPGDGTRGAGGLDWIPPAAAALPTPPFLLCRPCAASEHQLRLRAGARAGLGTGARGTRGWAWGWAARGRGAKAGGVWGWVWACAVGWSGPSP